MENKKINLRLKKEIIIWIILWVIIWGLITNILFLQNIKSETKNTNELITAFYDTEVSVNVSAHSLRKKIESGDDSFILVDIRSQEEYDEEHIKSSISIPAYTDRDNTGNTSKDRVLESFKQLDSSKEIILYCYSHYCMSSRKMWAFLAKNDIFVKHLTLWWNEWRYYWSLWNYPNEEDKTMDSIESNPFLIKWDWIINWCEGKWDFSC